MKEKIITIGNIEIKSNSDTNTIAITNTKTNKTCKLTRTVLQEMITKEHELNKKIRETILKHNCHVITEFAINDFILEVLIASEY